MACVLGCGIDIEERIRFTKHIQPQGNSSLIEKIFTPEEIHFNIKNNPSLRFALGFSCKESVFKALGVSWMNSPMEWTDIELVWKDGADILKHEIKLHNYAMELFQNMGGDQLISDFEFNNEYVFFKVMIAR